ncbi:MAG: hypothetical protein KTR28_00675 [Micavibrio sp.]|nr:hypothetical protein [Micavibrio sp.]
MMVSPSLSLQAIAQDYEVNVPLEEVHENGDKRYNSSESIKHYGHDIEHEIDSAADQESATIPLHHGDHGGDHAKEGYEGGHGEKHAEGLPQFDPSTFPTQIFWLTAVFILLYIFFSRKTLPDISKVLDTRQGHIQNDLDMADDLKNEAEKVRGAYEEILQEARHTSSEAFATVEGDIKAKTEKMTKEYTERAAAEMEKTEKAVSDAKTAVMSEIDTVAAKVAAEAAERIIGVKVDESYASSIVSSLQGKKKAA